MPRTSAAVATLAMLALAATPAVTQAAPVNVTANPAIARDLRLAAAFWDARRPDLRPICPVQVYVGRTARGVGNDGQLIAATDVWAETELGGCRILLSAVAWSEARSSPRIGGRYGVCTIVWHGSTGTCETSGWSQFDVCNRIAHEYAHTLGLGDTAHGPRILNQAATGGDPVCAAAYYGHRSWPRWPPRRPPSRRGATHPENFYGPCLAPNCYVAADTPNLRLEAGGPGTQVVWGESRWRRPPEAQLFQR